MSQNFEIHAPGWALQAPGLAKSRRLEGVQAPGLHGPGAWIQSRRLEMHNPGAWISVQVECVLSH